MSIWHHISSFCSSVVQCVGIILEQDQPFGVARWSRAAPASYIIILATSAVGGLFLNIKKKKKSKGVILIGLCGPMFFEWIPMAKAVQWLMGARSGDCALLWIWGKLIQGPHGLKMMERQFSLLLPPLSQDVILRRISKCWMGKNNWEPSNWSFHSPNTKNPSILLCSLLSMFINIIPLFGYSYNIE